MADIVENTEAPVVEKEVEENDVPKVVEADEKAVENGKEEIPAVPTENGSSETPAVPVVVEEDEDESKDGEEYIVSTSDWCEIQDAISRITVIEDNPSVLIIFREDWLITFGNYAQQQVINLRLSMLLDPYLNIRNINNATLINAIKCWLEEKDLPVVLTRVSLILTPMTNQQLVTFAFLWSNLMREQWVQDCLTLTPNNSIGFIGTYNSTLASLQPLTLDLGNNFCGLKPLLRV